VFRTIFSCKNAELQTQARLLGHVEPLDEKEVELAAAYNLRPGPLERAWDYWAKRVRDAEARVAPGAKAAPARAKTGKPKTAKAAPKKPAKKPAAKAKTRKR
jgi:HCOMODA/2-hydroxy-3-carboxy-muconic semialdehyde decarboxylase